MEREAGGRVVVVEHTLLLLLFSILEYSRNIQLITVLEAK